MKRIIIISISIVCVALIGLAVAAGPGSGRDRSPEEKLEHLKIKITYTLELDDTQKAALDRIVDDIMAERQQHKHSREAFKTNFKELLSKEQVSSEELLAFFQTKKPVIENMMQFASEHIAEFHSILTPEQRETLIAEMESYQGRRCRFIR